MILGTHTSENEPNYLMLAQVQLPLQDEENDATNCEDDMSELYGFGCANGKLTCLDEWASIERDHTNSVTSVIQDLQASTIRIPVTGGAKGDIETVKAAVCSAVDVMQAMGSSLCSVLSRVEAMNTLVSELADVAAHERATLIECELVLGSTTALQMQENSLRTHLLQMKEAYGESSSMFGY